MALHLIDPDVERLAAEVAELAQESTTEAMRQSLLERKARLHLHRGTQLRKERLEITLRTQVWPQIPPSQLGKPISKAEWERLLGYGPNGV